MSDLGRHPVMGQMSVHLFESVLALAKNAALNPGTKVIGVNGIRAMRV